MVISQITGRNLTEINDPERKRFVAYRIAQSLVNKFIESLLSGIIVADAT